MVAIARGLAADPKILAVDEPCLGQVLAAMETINPDGSATLFK